MDDTTLSAPERTLRSSIDALDLNLGSKRSPELPKASSRKGPSHRSSRSCTGFRLELPPISEGDETLCGADGGQHVCEENVESCALPNASQELLVANLVDSGGPFAMAVALGLGPRETIDSSAREEKKPKEPDALLRALRLAFILPK